MSTIANTSHHPTIQKYKSFQQQTNQVLNTKMYAVPAYSACAAPVVAAPVAYAAAAPIAYAAAPVACAAPLAYATAGPVVTEQVQTTVRRSSIIEY